MKLIVGLGNPGKKYENNRHNIGFKIIDNFSKEENISLSFSNKFNGEIYKGKISGNDVIIAKPFTFMNNSGIFVKKILDYYQIKKDDLLIIVDDKDLDLGVIKIKNKGSSGGQNGINNIIDNLSSNEFLRIKVGIGKPNNILIKDYVLQDFRKSEKEKIEIKLNKINSLINDFISGYDFLKLANKYNEK